MIIHYVITTNIELFLLKHAYEMLFYFYFISFFFFYVFFISIFIIRQGGLTTFLFTISKYFVPRTLPVSGIESDRNSVSVTVSAPKLPNFLVSAWFRLCDNLSATHRWRVTSPMWSPTPNPMSRPDGRKIK